MNKCYKISIFIFLSLCLLNCKAESESSLTQNHKKSISYDCKYNLKKDYDSVSQCKRVLLISIKRDGILFNLNDFDKNTVKKAELSCSGIIKKGIYQYNDCLGMILNVDVTIEDPPIIVANIPPEDEYIEDPNIRELPRETDQSKILSAHEIYNKVVKSSFQVWATDDLDNEIWSCGSAVVIAKNKLATNCHVVLKELSNFKISSTPHKHIFVINHKVDSKYNENWKDAKVFAKDPNNDTCIIQSSLINASPIKIKPFKDIKMLEKVYAIGGPKCKRGVITSGEIQNKYDFGYTSIMEDGSEITFDIPMLQTNAHIRGGSSGGGLFDSEANLIGITTLGEIDTTHANPWNIAISADNYIKLLNK